MPFVYKQTFTRLRVAFNGILRMTVFRSRGEGSALKSILPPARADEVNVQR